MIPDISTTGPAQVESATSGMARKRKIDPCPSAFETRAAKAINVLFFSRLRGRGSTRRSLSDDQPTVNRSAVIGWSGVAPRGVQILWCPDMNGQREMEFGSLAGGAFEPDPPAVHLDDLPGDLQPKTRIEVSI